MTAYSPFADRAKRAAETSGRWPLNHGAVDPEGERLEAYAAEMTQRDPLGRRWFVTGEFGRRYVDCGPSNG